MRRAMAKRDGRWARSMNRSLGNALGAYHLANVVYSGDCIVLDDKGWSGDDAERTI